MQGMSILHHEADEFVKIGSKINIVNPQSFAEDGFQGKYLTISGERKIDLTRLDYLALGSNPVVKQIMIDSINQHDLSCPASQMIMQAEPSIQLEKSLAELHGMKESIVFSNGYSANINVIQALGTRINTPHMTPYFRSMGIGKSTSKTPTIFFVDSESHYSLVQGMRNAKSLLLKISV